MWQYNDFSKMTTRRNESELYHSDTYLGVEFSDGIRHWKYIKKEKMSNGKFRYYYKNDNLDQLDKERSESFNKAMKESTKYSTVGTRYNYGSNKDTVHYQVERKDYSEEKANAAWKEYKKKSNKWAAAKVADIPRRIIGKGMAWVANLFQR